MEFDSTGYDLLIYDIMVRYGLFKNFEIALKYSYPSSALIRVKFGLINKPISIATEFGIGQYKLTNKDYKTDYIIDLYPGIILEAKIYKQLSFYFTPKLIYSFYIADRFSKTPRVPWETKKCIQYGYC